MIIWRQLVFFLPSLSHPSPLLYSVTVASQVIFPLSRLEGGMFLGRGAWGGMVARRPSLSLVTLGRFLPLLGFLPRCFGLTD